MSDSEAMRAAKQACREFLKIVEINERLQVDNDNLRDVVAHLRRELAKYDRAVDRPLAR